MHKNLYSAKTLAILLSFVFLTQNIQAQEEGDAKQINALVENNASAIQMSSYDRLNSRVSDAYYSKQSGLTLVYLQQTYKGIDVYNSIKVLAFKNDKVVSAAGTLIPKIESSTNNAEGIPALEPGSAVIAAANHLNLTVATSLKPLQFTESAKEADFGDLGISSESVKAKLLWMPDDKGQRIILCWQVEIQPYKSADHWLIRIDAKDGSFVNKDNLTVKCDWQHPVNPHGPEYYKPLNYDSLNAWPQLNAYKNPETINSAKYRVIPFPVEAPSFPGGSPTLVINPWLLAPSGSPATSLKWNDVGSTSYAISRGNNVYAQEDHDANNNTFGKSAKSITPVPDLDFDYTPNFNGEPQDSLNLGFSLTNLFYWNNVMHDLTYQYGFDEVSGNFQVNNQGRGGLGNDNVIADGQDAVALDNSDFATPPDGQNPRMQMFLFDFANAEVCLINSPASDAGFKFGVEGNLSSNNSLAKKGPLTANVVLYKDASGNDSACNAAANAAALKGKIALIYRGDCTFVIKIKNAQEAGAIGVIMVNNVPGGQVVVMSGSDNTITIPAVMITNEDGNVLKQLLIANKTVNATLKVHYLDGSLDAGVMSHEYTHGISNRLTGGPSNTACLENAEQMGEGWSDYDAIMITTDWSKAQLTDGAKARPLGTYVVGELPTDGGIRKYPYSTDMSIDPWTYDMMETQTQNGEVHLTGEIWCTALWEMTWDIIQQDGVINPHLYNAANAGGNSVALKLVIEAMKLQPCSPGFIDGRDAILRADTLLYNGKYSCSIWKAFAKRGMGVKASEGSSKSTQDQDANFSIPNNALVTKHVDKDSASQGEVLTYTITSACKCADLTNLKIVDTLPASVTYVSGGSYNSANRTVTFSGISLAASQSKDFSLAVKVNNGTYFTPTTLFSDSVNSSTISAVWQNQSTSGTTWTVVDTLHNSGTHSYFAYDSSKQTNESLVTKNAYLLSGVSTLSFWHFYDSENSYDGGVVELSTDNGATWTDLGPYMTQNGYNSKINPSSLSPLAGRAAFTGNSGHFINTVVNLAYFAGQQVKIRFTFASDDINKGLGWYLDDISLKSKAAVYNKAQLFTNADSLENAADTISVIKSSSLPVIWGGFTAVKQNNVARLDWKTLQELNTSKFIVERSSDGLSFYEIGNIPAAGNSNFSNNYQFTDAAPLQGLNYYRIKQVDKDGKFDYSEVRSLTFSGLNGLISISPNPARDKISITVTGNTKALKIYLVNGAGQQLHVYDMNGQYMQLNLQAVAAGVYYVRIEGDGVSSQHKLVIE